MTTTNKTNNRTPMGATNDSRKKHEPVPGTIRFVVGLFIVFTVPSYESYWAVALVTIIGGVIALSGQFAIKDHYDKKNGRA